MTSFLEDLEWRGLVQDISDRDAILKAAPTYGFYVGYDPSAPSLQLGNLVPIIVSLRLAKAGLKAIQLFGGATGAIGDPSGRSQERQLLSRETIDLHVENHKRTVGAIFERQGVQATFVNNYDWTADMDVLEFLRDIGKHFTVNYMLAKEVVKTRMDGEGISFTEFSYMLLQSHDFLHLFQRHGCKLQIGGSDQWGNMTAGLELIRKKLQGEAFAFSIPLILDSQGKKFGKSEGGTLWLDPAATSPYRFHQFWLNVDDNDAIRYLKIFTFLSHDEINCLASAAKEHPEKREAQRALADSVCTIVHGEGATASAKRGAEVLFGGSLSGLGSEELLEIFRDVPSSSFPREQLIRLDILDVFAATGLTKSKGEARRLIANGGAYLNNERITNPDLHLSHVLSPVLSPALSPAGSNENNLLVLRAGKKSYHLLKVSGP